MSVNLSRNTRLWVSTVKTGHNNSNTFEIPIQDGYTLSQAVSTTDVGIEEAGPTPTRGGKRFNTNLEPVEWGFSTYLNPYVHATDNNHYTTDMLLWHALASADATDFDNVSTTSAIFGDASKLTVGFQNNSQHLLAMLYLYFKIDNDVYLVEGVQVGQAEISIDISDIGMVAWSGNALTRTRIAAPAFMSDIGNTFDADTLLADTYVAIPSNKKYLVNKLTTLAFQSDVSGATLHYSIPITGATVTINNNITYLTPSTLSEVDSPIGSFTGAFEVSGNLEAYMRDTGNDGSSALLAKGTTELLADMLGNLDKVTNTTDVTINIGGEANGTPVAKILMPTVHIAVPEVTVEDVVSTSIEFKAIPTSTDLQSGDEISLEISAAQT